MYETASQKQKGKETMIITGCFDIIVETNDDVLTLEKSVRPVGFNRASENTYLCG